MPDKPVHRNFFRNKRKGEKHYKPPLVVADPVITARGVTLRVRADKVVAPTRGGPSTSVMELTPSELKNLARWAYALAAEAEAAAAAGYVSDTSAYDVQLSKVVRPPADH